MSNKAAKRRRQAARSSEREKPAITPTRDRAKALGRRLAMFVTAVSTVIGLFAAAISLLPRVVVQPLFMWNPNEALTTQFVVRNSGFLPLQDVRCDCIFLSVNGEKLKTGRQNCEGCGEYISVVPAMAPFAKSLPLDGEATTNCNYFAAPSLPNRNQYDLALVLHFRPTFVPWTRTKLFRFETTTNAHGQLQWMPKPITEEVEQEIANVGPVTIHRKGTVVYGDSPAPATPPKPGG